MDPLDDGRCIRVSQYGEQKVRFLLKHHPELASPKSIWGNTALHTAASYQMQDLTRQILDIGADINARDKDGETPLHEVTKNKAFAKLLIDHGAVVNAQDLEDEQYCISSLIGLTLSPQGKSHSS